MTATPHQSDAEFLHDLAGRMFRTVTPMMGFDQGDTDRLHRIARNLAESKARHRIAALEGAAKVADSRAQREVHQGLVGWTVTRARLDEAARIATAIRNLAKGSTDAR